MEEDAMFSADGKGTGINELGQTKVRLEAVRRRDFTNYRQET